MESWTWAIERVLSHHATPRDAVFHCVAGGVGGATVEITPWARHVVRCRFSAGTLPDTPGLSYVTGAPDPDAVLNIQETSGGLLLSTDALTLEIGLNPWRLAFSTASGHLLTREVNDDTELSGAFVSPPPGFEVEGPTPRIPMSRVVRGFETLLLDPDDHWYGLGEKFLPLDRRGRTVTMWQSNAAGARSEKAYKNMPLVMTPRGYGVFVNATSRVVFFLGSRSTRAWTIDVPGGVFEYFFIAGTLAEILTAHAGLTGFPQVPPKWSFGLWASTCFVRADEAAVRARARRLRDEQIPADVIHLDSYWQRQTHWSDLSWDPAAFPHPESLVSDLHAQGFKVCLWENSYVSIHSDLFREGAERGYFLKRGDGSVYTAQMWGGTAASLCAIVDFTNPDAAAWFRGKHLPLLAMGVDTFKTDFGEEIPADAVFHNGRTGAEMRNLYARLYQELIFELVRAQRGEGLIWARAGCPGVQRFPTHWSGDPHCTYEDMASTLRGGLSAGMSGLAFWSHDIGGFYGRPTPDLYVRWAQFGLLSTHARYHGTTVRDPWEYGEEALEIFRRYAQLRYRLIPYLDAYARMAAETGLPVMRPMVLRYQDDPATFGLDLQYLLGDELLIAPVFAPDGRATVYLPRGRWTEFWTDIAHQGPATHHLTVPLDRLPVFVRDDSLIPLAPPMSHVEEREADPLTVEAYVTRDATFTIQREDGPLSLLAHREGAEVEFDAARAPVTYVLRLHGCADAEAVSADGAPLPRVGSEADLAGRPEGWAVEGGRVSAKARARRILVRGCRCD